MLSSDTSNVPQQEQQPEINNKQQQILYENANNEYSEFIFPNFSTTTNFNYNSGYNSSSSAFTNNYCSNLFYEQHFNTYLPLQSSHQHQSVVVDSSRQFVYPSNAGYCDYSTGIPTFFQPPFNQNRYSSFFSVVGQQKQGSRRKTNFIRMDGEKSQVIKEQNDKDSRNIEAGDYEEGKTDNESNNGKSQENASSIEDIGASGDRLHQDVLSSSTPSKRSDYKNSNKNDAGKKQQDLLPIVHVFSEDMRISKILRRLCAENDPQAAIELCEKLKTAVMDSANAAYIRRAFDFLAESVISILHQGPLECLNHVATIFGMLGYVMRNDFPIYKNWLVREFDHSKEIRVYLMKALKTTVQLDAKTLDLLYYSDRTLALLKDWLENSEVDDFISISDVIVEFAKYYKKSFEKHFADVVDIVVYWHLDTEQTSNLKRHCSYVLQEFSEFFIKKFDFTVGLLGQFLEDITGCGEDIRKDMEAIGTTNTVHRTSSPLGSSPEINAGSYIGAFTSVMKCLATELEIIAFKLSKKLFNEAVSIITQVAQITLRRTTSRDTIESINEFFITILAHGGSQLSYDPLQIFEIIKLQIKSMKYFNNRQIDCLLYFLIVYVKTLKVITPISMISFTLNTTTCKDLANIKFTTNLKHYKLLLKFYHRILTIKNVPLLQEAYKFILLDIKLVIQCLNTSTNENCIITDGYSIVQAECVLNFYLSALAVLATQTSSIIGMYALKPSILELLINDLQASNLEIWSRFPALHDSIITLLSVHCIKNHNYEKSSNLLATTATNMFSKLTLSDTSGSPTSENFTIILKFLFDILSVATQSNYTLSEDITCTILEWIIATYEGCQKHAKILKDHPYFVGIGKRICLLSIQVQFLKIVMKRCAKCMQTILQYPVSQINVQILHCIAEVCCIHMFSTDNEIRALYTKIYAILPLGISLRQSYEITGLFKSRESQLIELQHWYIAHQHQGNLREKYFKYFIDKVTINSTGNTQESTDFTHFETFLKDIFPKCWIYQTNGRFEEFCNAAQINWNCLVSWIQWEASKYCVNNKLRTSLGKPQDTFLKIESIVKDYARVLALKGDSNVKSFEMLIENQKNARILLGFIECLEKAIYNAAEGTAFAIPAPEKPIKTFFRLNTFTCNEWFSRIRNAINLIALHTMEPEMVIRNSEVMLQMLISSNRIAEPVFEHVLMSIVWALLKTGETEALHGLYIWTKKVTGKRIAWIKYAAEHAAGHREKAAEGYLNVIASSDEKLEGTIREFLSEQIIDCFYFTSQWDELKEFLTNDQHSQSTSKRSTSPLMSLTTTQIESIINIERENTDQTLLELSDWEIFDENKEEFSNNFSCHKLLSLTENTLVNIAVNRKNGVAAVQNVSKQLQICADMIHSGLQQCLRTKTREHFNNYIVLNYFMNQIAEMQSKSLEINQTELLNSISAFSETKIHGSVTLTRIVRWMNLLQPESFSEELNLQIIALARKEGNLKFCNQELDKFFKRHKTLNMLAEINSAEMTDFQQIYSNILEMNSNVWTKDILRAVNETGKCWFSSNSADKHEQAIQLVSSCCISAMTKATIINWAPREEIPERLSRMLLNLADWLPQGGAEILSESHSEKPIQKLLASLPNIDIHLDEKVNSIVSPLDAAVGKLIRSSTRQCPNLAKAWGALGNWFYRWGRKIVESRTDGTHADKAGLRSADIEAIKNLLPIGCENDIDKIVKILNRHQVTADDEEIGANDASSTELIENQLREIEILKDVDFTVILSIIQIWKQAYKSIYGYYEIAASSYFRYLNLAATVNTEHGGNNEDENENQSDCSTVTATLRLLRLVVKHAVGLQEVLEEGLTTTPTKPWKVIIPQLFSRLNHHESYVRKRVSELLCRVAEDSPHLIIFPAVVGAIQEEKTNSNSNDEDDSFTNNPLTLCFNSLLETLSKQAPETVEQVQMLVRELKRVTLLWDEYWLHSLAQLYSEYSELFNALESEVRNSSEDKNDMLIEKHRVLMSYVADDIRKIYKTTSREPETNYERNFQEKYSKIIESTIENLKKPLNFDKPNESWQKLKQLYAIFQQKLQKSTNLSLKMADLSPVLAKMKNTAISMPGVETNENNPIYIKSVDNVVHILPTKTKPKKLAFFGSDGKRYTYLFKGLEDLHLDERIMQFLSISNSMMSKSSSDYNGGNVTVYRAQHYSVIPLGPTSGLISWVDGVTPIFALYKKWQQREAANPRKDKQYTAMRPSELFYNKLEPLLAEHNMKTTDNRKNWPTHVLRKVLEELSNETPSDLLAKELWCNSNSAAAWRKSIRTYSLSVAVMSVIGYVIGLGDRHLDNVLVKLSTGDIVHIDYNVCFEKGKTLRVPEKVPFRMTPNLEAALGITGIEGTFRLACEHVLKTLRKERETLLTLLEAFVYDPLVDWAMNDDGSTASARTTKALIAASDIAAIATTFTATTTTTSSQEIGTGDGNSTGDSGLNSSNPSTPDHRRYSKRKFENEMMRNNLTSRFVEIKPEWTQYRNDIIEILSEMEKLLLELTEQQEKMSQDEQKRDLLSRQLAMIREVETLGTAMSSHPLNTASQRYNTFKLSLDEYNSTQNILREKQIENEKKYQLYYEFIEETDISKINEFQSVINEIAQLQIESEFDLVKDFLENSTQSVLYVQADQALKELNVSFIQQSFVVKVTLDTLTQYINIMQFCPRTILKNHRFVQYANWFQRLLEDPTCYNDVQSEFQNTLLSDTRVDKKLKRSIDYSVGINKLWIEMDFNLRKNFDLLQSEPPEFNEQFLKESQDAIKMFLQVETDSQAALHYEYVLAVTDLCENYILFEESYTKTNKEIFISNLSGILDEHYSYLIQLIETTKLIFCNNLEILTKCSQYLETLNSLCKTIQSFRDMESLFQCQIIPKCCQLFMTEDLNVMKIFDGLIDIQSKYDFELVNKKLNNKINCRDDIEMLKLTYEKIKKIQVTSFEFEKFQVLLEQIEKTFETIKTNLNATFVAVKRLSQNEQFEMTDHVTRSKLITHLISDSCSIDLCLQKFDLQKYQTISNFISIAKQMSTSLKENNLQLIYDIRIMQHPISNFISDCLLELILGQGCYTTSMFEVQLLNAVVSNIMNLNPSLPPPPPSQTSSSSSLLVSGTIISIKNTVLSHIEHNLTVTHLYSPEIYAFAKSSCCNYILTLKKQILSESLKRIIYIQTENLQHFNLIANAHYWTNEKILKLQTPFTYILPKAIIVQNFQNSIQNLNAWQISIAKIKEELQSYITAVTQRLKWAVGANQQLQPLEQSFHEIVVKHENKFKENMKIAENILQYCISIVNYEKIKVIPNEIIENDKKFLSYIDQHNAAYLAYKNYANNINAIEEGIVQLLDPEGPVDHFWINNISDLLDEMTDNVQQNIADIEKGIQIIQDNLQSCANKLRTIMDNDLRLDVRNLLKMLLKIDGGSQVARYKQFQSDYKQFLSKIGDLHLKILSKDFTEEIIKEMLESINKLKTELDDIYNELLNLISERDGSDRHDKRDRSEDKSGSTSKDVKKVGNQPEQKRNAYGVSVWRRIRMKLEGRDPDPNRRLTIPEQVDWMIREAMNPDNLAVLYEGWTPWV